MKEQLLPFGVGGCLHLRGDKENACRQREGTKATESVVSLLCLIPHAIKRTRIPNDYLKAMGTCKSDAIYMQGGLSQDLHKVKLT